MDILEQGASMLKEKLGIDADLGKISESLRRLLGDAAGKLDLSGLVAKMTAASGGLKDIVGSWLGGGENAGSSADQIANLLGGDKVSQFAGSLGVQAEAAMNALADVLPKLVDKASRSGSLVGMAGDLMDKAKKFF